MIEQIFSANRLERRLRRFGLAIGLAAVAICLPLIAFQVWRWAGPAPSIGAPSPLPRLVEFRAPWCPACQRMAPRIAQLKKDCEHHDIEIVEIDVSDERYQELAQQYEINGLPSIGLLRADGTLAGKLVGDQPIEALRSAADTLGAGCSGGEPGPATAPSESGAACGSAHKGSGGAPVSCGM
jgi:thioredoxin 1